MIKIYKKSPKNFEKIHKFIAAEDSRMMKHGVQQKNVDSNRKPLRRYIYIYIYIFLTLFRKCLYTQFLVNLMTFYMIIMFFSEQRMVLEVNWGLGKSTNSISNIKVSKPAIVLARVR